MLKPLLFNSLKIVNYCVMNHNTQKPQQPPNNHSEHVSLMAHLRPRISLQLRQYKPTSIFSQSVHLSSPCVYQTISPLVSAVQSSHHSSDTNWSAQKKQPHPPSTWKDHLNIIKLSNYMLTIFLVNIRVFILVSLQLRRSWTNLGVRISLYCSFSNFDGATSDIGITMLSIS